MEDDLIHLTFLDDPLAYQTQADEIVVRIPANVSSPEELINILTTHLGLPVHGERNWYALRDALSYWDNWQTTPQSVALVHTNVPFEQSSERLWYIDLEGYIGALSESIAVLQARNSRETDPLKQRKLVAIFPVEAREKLHAVLNRPADWYLTLGFFAEDRSLSSDINPALATILQYIHLLDGVTAETCTLYQQDTGMMTVQYNRQEAAYYVEYASANQTDFLIATPQEPFSLPAFVSFSEVSAILETFLAEGQCSSTVHWYTLSAEEHYEIDRKREFWYYTNAEEALLEIDGLGTVRATIIEGIREAVGKEEEPFSLQFWQNLLAQADVSPVQRFAALCMVGRLNLPEAPASLHSLLNSSHKEERWISARFAGLWEDEAALPVLLSMLTDELPVTAQAANDYWYESWRLYAPRLLRRWANPQVGASLRESLVLWLQTEPLFDQDIDIWRVFEERLCYELGYREDFDAITKLPLVGQQRPELLAQMERGYQVKRLRMTAEEERHYLR